jgi:hypothetical protein
MLRSAALLVVAAGLFAGCLGIGEAGGERSRAAVWCPTDRGPNGERLRGVERGTFDARRVLRLTEARAQRLAKQHGCSVREIVRDGEELMYTMDLSAARINVATEDGVVVAIKGVF